MEAAVKAVVRGKNITEQSEVDKMAKDIEDAIAALEKKPASTKQEHPIKARGPATQVILLCGLPCCSSVAVQLLEQQL